MKNPVLMTILSVALAMPLAAWAQNNVPPANVTNFAPELAPHGTAVPSNPVTPPAVQGDATAAQAVPSNEAAEAAKRREAAKLLKEQKKAEREKKKEERLAAMEKKKAEREAKREERKKKAEEREAKRKEKMEKNLPTFGRPETTSSSNSNSNTSKAP